MTPPPTQFLQLLDEHGIECSETALARFGQYLDLLLEANTQFNLTGIKDLEEAWIRHIFDSLTLLPLLQALSPERVVDVGPGGGLPSIPLAICHDACEFVLVEATGKKCNFLNSATGTLELEHTQVINDRAESFGQSGAGRGQFDVVLARAVGPMPILLELTVPLLRVGGMVLAIKGQRAEIELEAAERAMRLLAADHVDTVPTPTGRIVMIEKTRPTPKAYPRRPGEPKREPL